MKIKWSRKALRSLEEATEYIREENPYMAERVSDSISQCVDNLRRFPKIGVSTRFADTRDLVHHKYNFVIRYHIKKDVIYIVFVWHTSQNVRR